MAIEEDRLCHLLERLMLYVMHLMFLNIKVHHIITEEKEDNQESPNLLNGRKREYNKYLFSSLYKDMFRGEDYEKEL